MLSNKNYGLGTSVVLEFEDAIQKKNSNVPYSIYFDNYFTTLKLFGLLSDRGLKGTGTIRENRLGKNFDLPNSNI
mgnify:CR=1 FL=1